MCIDYIRIISYYIDFIYVILRSTSPFQSISQCLAVFRRDFLPHDDHTALACCERTLEELAKQQTLEVSSHVALEIYIVLEAGMWLIWMLTVDGSMLWMVMVRSWFCSLVIGKIKSFTIINSMKTINPTWDRDWNKQHWIISNDAVYQ